jgi:hypothetical protein
VAGRVVVEGGCGGNGAAFGARVGGGVRVGGRKKKFRSRVRDRARAGISPPNIRRCIIIMGHIDVSM